MIQTWLTISATLMSSEDLDPLLYCGRILRIEVIGLLHSTIFDTEVTISMLNRIYRIRKE